MNERLQLERGNAKVGFWVSAAKLLGSFRPNSAVQRRRL
jgi:hypothetical protein